MFAPAVYAGPAAAALVAIAVGVGLLAYRTRIVALYARAGPGYERVARRGVPVLGVAWLLIGLFGLAVSLLEL